MAKVAERFIAIEAEEGAVGCCRKEGDEAPGGGTAESREVAGLEGSDGEKEL